MKRMINPVRIIMNLALICWTLFIVLVASVGFIIFLVELLITLLHFSIPCGLYVGNDL